MKRVLIAGAVLASFIRPGASQSPPTFEPPVRHVFPQDVRLRTYGDFTGDGLTDVILMSPRVPPRPHIRLFPAISPGVYGDEIRTDMPFWFLPHVPTALHLDGDDDLDFVVVHCELVFGGTDLCTVYSFLGRGDGTFEAADIVDIGYELSGLHVADLDADGDDDLLINTRRTTSAPPVGDTRIVSLLSLGDGTFQDPVIREFPVHHLDVGDFDGDGLPDVVATASIGDPFIVALGRGDGTFEAVSEGPIAYPAYPSIARAGDFNGDGLDDLVLNATALGIRFATGGGSFSELLPVADPSLVPAMSPLDLNGDGLLDLVLDAPFDNVLTLLPGRGSGDFGPAVSLPYPIQPVEFVDFDGDSLPDFVHGNDLPFDPHDDPYALSIHFNRSPGDADGDGVTDDVDVCPHVFDPEQADADLDTLGDACDECPDSSNLVETDLILNGGFESIYDGWTRSETGLGGWRLNDGVYDPPGPGGPLPPLSGLYNALSASGTAGSSVLEQTVVLPDDAVGARLAWTGRMRNHADEFVDDVHEASVRLLTPWDDLVAEAWSTSPGDPLVDPTPVRRELALGPLARLMAGREVRVRIEALVFLNLMNVEIDDVELIAQTTGPCVEPNAVIVAETLVQCAAPSGTPVTLDGSGSTDPNSTPGTNDDIISFEWFENVGAPDEMSLGSGPIIEVAFSLGAHEVSLVVEDRDGHVDTSTVTIVVEDTAAPTISPVDDVVAECTSPDGATPTLVAPRASDVCCGDDVTVETVSAGGFPLGETPVTWVATDCNGIEATTEQVVRVVDSTAPTLGVELDPATVWPPDHRMVPIGAAVTAVDACGDSDFVLESVNSDEPDDAPGAGDGATVDDVQDALLGTPDLSFEIRAERSAQGDGRVYLVTYIATDAAGNQATASATVVVPHDRGARVGPDSDASSVQSGVTTFSGDPAGGTGGRRQAPSPRRTSRTRGDDD